MTVQLPRPQTDALLRAVPAAYRTQINDVLLTAVARTLGAWTRRHAAIGPTERHAEIGDRDGAVLVDLEGHGREALAPDGPEPTRTVGWFTTIHPVRLHAMPDEPVRATLMRVKEHLRGVPHRGLGYGLLQARPAGDATAGAATAPRTGAASDVEFNYLGQVDSAPHAASGWRLSRGARGLARSARAPLEHRLEINGLVLDGVLRLSWTYSRLQYRAATVEQWAAQCLEELTTLIAASERDGPGGYTPSDFPLSGLTQGELDRIVGAARDVEDIYPLSPLQAGLLYHAISPAWPDAYHQQISCRLVGTLDATRFRAAWSAVAARHGALRTRFAWEGARAPVQVVHQHPRVTWDAQDWRALDVTTQARTLAAFREWHRRAGADVTQGTPWRVALLRTGASTHEFVWSYHHLLLDGWSAPVVIADVLHAYAGTLHTAAPAGQFRDYVAWLRRQDLHAAEHYWRQRLAGVSAPTPLPGPPGLLGPRGTAAATSSTEPGEHTTTLGPEATARLQQFARRRQVTLSTLVQAAWGLFLSRYGAMRDVVFGTVVSGRPAELPRVEATVGLFINTLPVRVSIAGTQPVAAWLDDLQTQSLDTQRFSYAPLTAVHGWSSVPRTQPLFETLYVFENYPLPTGGAGAGAHRPAVAIDTARQIDRPHYPLNLVADAGDTLTLLITFDPARFTPHAIAHMADALLGTLAAFADADQVSLHDFIGRCLAIQQRHRADAGSTYAAARRRQLARLSASRHR